MRYIGQGIQTRVQTAHTECSAQSKHHNCIVLNRTHSTAAVRTHTAERYTPRTTEVHTIHNYMQHIGTHSTTADRIQL